MAKYTIWLNEDEVKDFTSIINKGKHSSQTFKTAYILLNCDKGEFSENKNIINKEICKILKISARTIDRIKKKFIEEGFEKVLDRRPSSRNYIKKTDGDFEAKLVTLCCSKPPKGFAKWSLRLLADKLVELKYIDQISHTTVGNILKKTNLSLGK